MTTRVVVQNDAQSQLNIGVRAANRGQEPSESDLDATIGPGAEHEFWIHDGYDLTVSELQAGTNAAETDQKTPPAPTESAGEGGENQSGAADSEGSTGGDPPDSTAEEIAEDKAVDQAQQAESDARDAFPRQTIEIKVGNEHRDLGCVIDRPGSEERFMLEPFTTVVRELGRDDIVHIFPVWGERGEAFHTAIAEQTDPA